MAAIDGPGSARDRRGVRVSKPAAVDALIAAGRSAHSRVDILVNAPGSTAPRARSRTTTGTSGYGRSRSTCSERCAVPRDRAAPEARRPRQDRPAVGRRRGPLRCSGCRRTRRPRPPWSARETLAPENRRAQDRRQCIARRANTRMLERSAAGPHAVGAESNRRSVSQEGERRRRARQGTPSSTVYWRRRRARHHRR